MAPAQPPRRAALPSAIVTTVPSTSLIANLRAELMRTAPFAQMAPAHVDRFIAASRQAYYAPGETLLAPADGAVSHLLLLRQGEVTARRSADAAAAGLYEEGDLFPVGAVMGDRAVVATYRANVDTFCLRLPVAAVHGLAAESAAFADFLNRRVLRYLDESRQALQANYAAQALAEQSLETPLAALMQRVPVGVSAAAPLAEALALMHERRIGSLLVFDANGAAVGIFTRHDVLARVALAGRPPATPIAQVMSTPLHTLGSSATAQDAALLMSRQGIRHLPVTDAGRVVGIVSERDLFALQRLSIGQLGKALRNAPDAATLQQLGAEIRRLARNLLGQGVGARQLTELISHLNDLLTERLVVLVAAERGLDLGRACWLAFGSEGRSEQTIATDQDNGLVFESDDAARDRPAWLAFGRAVNEALAACGYPLCKGGVMAGNPACCLTAAEWASRFQYWMAHGAPGHLLQASIYFDLRPLAGRLELAAPLRALITREAARLPRFMQQMALNALTRQPALNWLGGIETGADGGVDLKLQGTAVFVDAARLYALAHGVAATATRARFEAVARAIGIAPHEGEAWTAAFEFLQRLRLQVQLEAGDRDPNRVGVDTLNDIDRRMLKESLHIARRLQQRIELDYRR
jgi:CBS domain-containing protein